MDTATGVIPECFFSAEHKPAVLAVLSALVMPGKTKARVLKDWAKWTGAKLTADELKQLEASGVEAAPVIRLPGEGL